MPTIAAIATSAMIAFPAVAAIADERCPVTKWDGNLIGDPFPEVNSWYGSEAFATALPRDVTFTATPDDARITMKNFWWSPGFRPGMEDKLTVTIENIFDTSPHAQVSEATNAGEVDGDKWYMLVGIDIPSAGCWRITGHYLGQELSFVIKTVDTESKGDTNGVR